MTHSHAEKILKKVKKTMFLTKSCIFWTQIMIQLLSSFNNKFALHIKYLTTEPHQQ
jgi:hypothetical protein